MMLALAESKNFCETACLLSLMYCRKLSRSFSARQSWKMLNAVKVTPANKAAAPPKTVVAAKTAPVLNKKLLTGEPVTLLKLSERLIAFEILPRRLGLFFLYRALCFDLYFLYPFGLLPGRYVVCPAEAARLPLRETSSGDVSSCTGDSFFV